jgi:hypothetical protein
MRHTAREPITSGDRRRGWMKALSQACQAPAVTTLSANHMTRPPSFPSGRQVPGDCFLNNTVILACRVHPIAAKACIREAVGCNDGGGKTHVWAIMAIPTGAQRVAVVLMRVRVVHTCFARMWYLWLIARRAWLRRVSHRPRPPRLSRPRYSPSAALRSSIPPCPRCWPPLL